MAPTLDRVANVTIFMVQTEQGRGNDHPTNQVFLMYPYLAPYLGAAPLLFFFPSLDTFVRMRNFFQFLGLYHESLLAIPRAKSSSLGRKLRP